MEGRGSESLSHKRAKSEEASYFFSAILNAFYSCTAILLDGNSRLKPAIADCRLAVIVDLTKNQVAPEYEKLRSAIGAPESITPVSDSAFDWWRLVVSVPVSPVGDQGRLAKVRFDDVPAELQGDLHKMLLARNIPVDGAWLTDWAEFLVRRLVDLKRMA